MLKQAVEKQVNDWKEECDLVINEGRGKDDKYDVEVLSLRTEMAVLSQELLAL